MQQFNQEWREYVRPLPPIHDNQAYKEFYRTKGLSAWNFEVQPIIKKGINQYYTVYIWDDGSALKVSSNLNKIDRNSMRYYPEKGGLCFAERMLFGCTARMPWNK